MPSPTCYCNVSYLLTDMLSPTYYSNVYLVTDMPSPTCYCNVRYLLKDKLSPTC